jgi:putative ABC transport system substrate-binding protein
MAIHIQRRDFITLLDGAAVWPFVARAQQPAMPVIGFLRSTPAKPFARIVAAFRQGLNRPGPGAVLTGIKIPQCSSPRVLE